MANTTYYTKFFEDAQTQGPAADQLRVDLGELTHTIYINVAPQVLVAFGCNSQIKDGLVQLPKIHREGLDPVYGNNRFLVVEVEDLPANKYFSFQSQGYWKFKEE